MNVRRTLLSILILALSGVVARAADRAGLEQGFRQPSAAARPWVYWFWLDGNITREGITADLEAMKRTGIGGVLIMEVDQGAPKGPARFGSPQWRELFKHVCAEANRLGLEVNMNNDAGWCGSGGPWVTPKLAMQKVVWTETMVEGPRRFEGSLAKPAVTADYYRDVAVLAFPTPAGNARIEGIKSKAVFSPLQVVLGAPSTWPSVPANATIPRDGVVELTAKLQPNGQIAWDVPPGKWTILRFGHTPTGSVNAPAPMDARGLECDKLSKEAAEAHFAGLMGKLVADVGPLVGKTLVSTHIDSWEVGVQNWTPRMRDEFRRLRGYDPLRFLPVMTGRVVDSAEVSERFLWDLRQTISELVLENYAGHFRELAHRNGLRLSIEAYNTCPCDEMAYAGRADEPMGEFWSWSKYGYTFSCTEMVSAAHVYGKRIVGAEAFTATDAERWLGHPGNVKDLGDWAFCEGINRFVFHRYAMQPWRDVKPGMSMGPWGLHYERTQTWWEQSKPWHEYLARCQSLLQQGLFVADICLLGPEGSPQSLFGQKAFLSKTPGQGEYPLERPAYNFDACPPEAVLTRMSVKDGRLVLPDGMSYRVLALSKAETMTPRLLRKIKDLVEAGATVIGAPPAKSPSLSEYPKCDQEIKDLVANIWGDQTTSNEILERTVGKGKIVWGGELAKGRDPKDNEPARLGAAKWIWRDGEGNPAVAAPPEKRYFRRIVNIPFESRLRSARLVMTADNSFECWVNGRLAGSGDNFGRSYVMDVKSFLKPGVNVVAVAAVNGATSPNPAGLIGSLVVRYQNGQTLEVVTDRTWEAAATIKDGATNPAAAEGWTPAMELGPLGMEPWGDVEQTVSSPDLYPDVEAICRFLKKQGAQPDFSYQSKSATTSLRYIHRTIGDADVYFVANKMPHPEEAVCSFRVHGKRPELWCPETGRIEHAAVYDEVDGRIRLPIRLEASGSVFVVFRDTAKPDGKRVLSVARNGQPVLDTEWKAGHDPVPDKSQSVVNTFTMAAWIKPEADTQLLPESNTGLSGFSATRNDALYPPPGHEVFANEGHVGCGLAVGRNGVCVFEHGADYFAPVLVHAAPVNGWTHVAVVYREGEPSLYLNGEFVRKGLKGKFTVHPGVGVAHGRTVAPFKGELGEFTLVNREITDEDAAQLAKVTPRPSGQPQVGAIRLARNAQGGLEVLVWEPGNYTLTTAEGRGRSFKVAALPEPLPVAGPWEVHFTAGGGAPGWVTLEKLISWSDHLHPGVKHFSGAATYRKTLDVPAGFIAKDRAVTLDLGRVEVMAEVKLNGKDLGVLWKTPFRVDVSDAVKPGENVLEVKVVNLWINRMIGDEELPEDSARNPEGTLKQWPQWLAEGKASPTGRHTFSSWKLWPKGAPLQPSGLLGPVILRSAARIAIPR